MKRIKARFNCGYWIWDCPVCKSGNRIKPGLYMAICGGCYKDKIAIKESIVNGVIIRGIDKDKQDRAKRQAYADNKVYQVSYPRDYKKIVAVLRVRKEEHQSWEVGETVEDLLEENRTHPELTYLVFGEGKEKKKEYVPATELPELAEKILRRIA